MYFFVVFVSDGSYFRGLISELDVSFANVRIKSKLLSVY